MVAGSREIRACIRAAYSQVSLELHIPPLSYPARVLWPAIVNFSSCRRQALPRVDNRNVLRVQIARKAKSWRSAERKGTSRRAGY